MRVLRVLGFRGGCCDEGGESLRFKVFGVSGDVLHPEVLGKADAEQGQMLTAGMALAGLGPFREAGKGFRK